LPHTELTGRNRVNERLRFEIAFGVTCALLGGVGLLASGTIHEVALLLVGLALGTAAHLLLSGLIYLVRRGKRA
jgi:hypothetical protein